MSALDLHLQFQGGCDDPDTSVEHNCDTECTIDPITNCCTQCGEQHGEPCEFCAGRAFHKPDCPELEGLKVVPRLDRDPTRPEWAMFTAVDDRGYEPGWPVGFGRTAEDAIGELREKHVERAIKSWQRKQANGQMLITLGAIGNELAASLLRSLAKPSEQSDPFAGQAGFRP